MVVYSNNHGFMGLYAYYIFTTAICPYFSAVFPARTAVWVPGEVPEKAKSKAKIKGKAERKGEKQRRSSKSLEAAWHCLVLLGAFFFIWELGFV